LVVLAVTVAPAFGQFPASGEPGLLVVEQVRPLPPPRNPADAPPNMNDGAIPMAAQSFDTATPAADLREPEDPRGPAPLPPLTQAAIATPTGIEEVADPAPNPQQDGLTLQQVQEEAKKAAWTKGDFRVVPYGFLWGNMVYSTQRTDPGTYTLFVQSPSTLPGSEYIVDGRNTRFGVDVDGPQIPLLDNARSGGKIEIDFQGAFSGTENKGSVLLRHAYVEVKNDDFRLLAGQTWDVISPLNPGMLMYSVGWDGGNIGYRRAQFRFERYLTVSDTLLVTAQSSLNQNVFPDVITNGLGQGLTIQGEPTSWPIIEGRVAVTLGERTGPDARPIVFGVSSHVGQQEFNELNSKGPVLFNQSRKTWSLNTDLRVPITDRFGFQCEFFTGEDLSQFLGGIGQGIDPATLCTIHSTGGWGEFWYDWLPCLHSHVGYSLDDPDNADLHTAGERTYNQFFFGNVIYDLTQQFLVGVEVSSWKTLYLDEAPGNSVRCEFVVKYGF
jgi:hypothetical protein